MNNTQLNIISLHHPGKLVFGAGCLTQFIEDRMKWGPRRLFILSISPLLALLKTRLKSLEEKGHAIHIYTGIDKEPSFDDLTVALELAREFKADGIIGIGGGAVMDTAKLLAALIKSDQSLEEVRGLNLIRGRSAFLACIPTTSGTGSEVSPNAIFHNEQSGDKEGVISPFLVPDAAYVDPELTLSLPAAETASTGMDALTHCIEAYANRFAHPVVDRIALEGIGLIGKSLKQAVDQGDDVAARSDLSLGSMYGGMCLGPVNTAAVHALAYPLGSMFRVAHGLANALLLPHVLRYNLPAAPDRYSAIARSLGAEEGRSPEEAALEGIGIMEQLMRDCKLPHGLSDLGISGKDIDRMTESAMKVRRLLKNNPKELTAADVRTIYRKAL